MAMIRSNTRLPIDTEGDHLFAGGCNDVGCQRLVEMIARIRHRVARSLGHHICDRFARSGPS